MDTDAAEESAIDALNDAFTVYASDQNSNTINVSAFLGSNLDFSAAEGTTLNSDNSNNIHAVDGWEVEYADADTWAVLQTHQSDNDGKLYMRKNWGSAATTLTVAKHRMLPVGKYQLSFSWNSDMANMTNLSQYALGEATTAIGENTNGTLVYEFEVSDAATPFDLTFGFLKTGMGNTPAQLIVDDVVLTYIQPAVTLADAADNTDVIDENDGKTRNITLDGRTLYKDGAWNTLCLPFSMSAEQIAASELAGADIRTLSSASLSDGGVLTLNFTPAFDENNLENGAVTAITAGKPYIIKWANGEPIENPTFENVTVTSTSPADDVVSTDGRVQFLGNYSYREFTETDKSILLMGGTNSLYYPVSGASIGAFRSYFQLSDGQQARQFVLNFGDGVATGIELLNFSQEEKDGASWYSVDGVKLNGKPTAKGLYIHGGRKIVIK
jgi:hypothetical protein